MPNFFKVLWGDICDLFTGAASFIAPFVKQLMTEEAKALRAAAAEGIARVALDPNMANAEWDVKLKTAVNYTLADLETQAVKVATTQAINMVQVLITNLKAQNEVAPVAPPVDPAA